MGKRKNSSKARRRRGLKRRIRKTYPCLAACLENWQDYEGPTVQALGPAGPVSLDEMPGIQPQALLLTVSGFLDTTTYQSIAAWARAAAASNAERVGVIYDTPGGNTAMMEEAAEALGKLRHDAYAIRASSAGYRLAAEAGRITADGNAKVGSLGVMTIVEESFEAARQAGLTVHAVTDESPLKAIGLPGTKFTPEMERFTRSQVAKSKARFLRGIAQARGVPLEQIQAAAGDGGEYVAEVAMDLGLISGIETLASFKARILGTTKEAVMADEPQELTPSAAQGVAASATEAKAPAPTPVAAAQTPVASVPIQTPAPAAAATAEAVTAASTGPGPSAAAEPPAGLAGDIAALAAKIESMQVALNAERRSRQLAESASADGARLESLNLGAEQTAATLAAVSAVRQSGGDPGPIMDALEQQAAAYTRDLQAGPLGRQVATVVDYMPTGAEQSQEVDVSHLGHIEGPDGRLGVADSAAAVEVAAAVAAHKDPSAQMAALKKLHREQRSAN